MKTWAAPITARSLVEEITERLEAAIISGELEPGARLSEQALAKSLGVSRGPLRESIRRLEGRRLIERTPHVGARIASLPAEDLEHILIAREALEGMAARLAAEHAGSDEIAALARLLDEHARQITRNEGGGYYQERHDFDFHFRIIRASGNPQLVRMLCDDLYDLLRVYRYKSSTVAGRAERALDEHREVLRAMSARDGDAAEAAMRSHLSRARGALFQADHENETGPVRREREVAAPKAPRGDRRGSPGQEPGRAVRRPSMVDPDRSADDC